MAVCTFIPVPSFAEAAFEKGHNCSTDTIKAMLATTVPELQALTQRSQLAEVANGNGYTTGGVTCTTSTSDTVNGLYSLALADPVAWSASGSGFSFNTVAFYNDTSASDLLLGLAFVSSAGQKSITNVSLSSNIATLTCNAHGYQVGDVVVVTELDNGVLNGTYTITSVTTNAFSYSRTAANITSAAVTAGKVIKPETITKPAGSSFAIQFGGAALFTVKVKGN